VNTILAGTHVVSEGKCNCAGFNVSDVEDCWGAGCKE
jgi:hypothetical protein